MLPGGALAAAFLLSLVPGWIFLVLTARVRRPRSHSALSESLELLAVGIGTTGVALVTVGLVWADQISKLDWSPETGNDLRRLLGWGLLAFGGSMFAAGLAAGLVRFFAPDSYGASVWADALAKRRIPKGQAAHAALTLSDGATVDGVLWSYTYSEDSAHRDIALVRPIRVTRKGHKEVQTPYNFLIVPAEQITSIAVAYTAKHPTSSHGGS